MVINSTDRCTIYTQYNYVISELQFPYIVSVNSIIFLYYTINTN